MVKISKSGSLSYVELKSLDIYEFFCIVQNAERENDKNR